MKKVAAQLTVFTASVMSLLAFVLHWPCRNSGYIDGRFTSMCYSDIAALVANPPLSSGDFPFAPTTSIDMAPLPALILWVISKLSSDFITLVILAQLILVVAFFVLTYATSLQRAWRPMDAAVIASMPLWPLVMFVSMDLLSVTFVALSLAYWTRERFIYAGVFAGAALLCGAWSWVLLLAYFVDALRLAIRKELLQTCGIASGAMVLGNLPVVLSGAPLINWSSQPSDGGILIVWRYAFGNEPKLANIIATLGVFALFVVARWAYRLPFDYRLETLLLLFVLIQLFTSPSIPPQSLVRLAWLVPLVFARRNAIISYGGILVAYVLTVWLHLEGITEGAKGAPDQAYALMCLIMLVTLGFMMYQVSIIMKVQGHDNVRQAMARFINENHHAAR